MSTTRAPVGVGNGVVGMVGVVVVVDGVVIVVVVVVVGGGGAAAPTCTRIPSSEPALYVGVAENEIDWNVPVSCTVPFASLRPSGPTGASAPMTEAPDTEKLLSPLSLVICVPAGKSSREASEASSSTGSVTGAPNCSVYENPWKPEIWISSLVARGGEKSGPEKPGHDPSITLCGGFHTCEPDSEIELPSNVPVAVLLLTAVQSANPGPAAPADPTTAANATPAAATPTHASAFTRPATTLRLLPIVRSPQICAGRPSRDADRAP